MYCHSSITFFCYSRHALARFTAQHWAIAALAAAARFTTGNAVHQEFCIRMFHFIYYSLFYFHILLLSNGTDQQQNKYFFDINILVWDLGYNKAPTTAIGTVSAIGFLVKMDPLDWFSRPILMTEKFAIGIFQNIFHLLVLYSGTTPYLSTPLSKSCCNRRSWSIS